MLDIPELDDLICQQLSRHDLLQCIRVNKKWHTAVIPYLWRDISYLYYRQKKAFCGMVLEDYLGEQQHQKWQQHGYAVRHGTPVPSTLSKYGPWIRILPDPEDLLNSFHGEIAARQIMSTAERLVLHLFKCCHPGVQVDFFEIGAQAMNIEPSNPKKTILDFTLPRVCHLRVRAISLFSSRDVSMLKNLLDQCSPVLQELELDVEASVRIGMNGTKEEIAMHGPKYWMSLKKLGPCRWVDNTDSRTFWPWFFKRYGQVERLEMHSVRGTTQVVVQGMTSHMSKLTEIALGTDDARFGPMEDKEVAELLSGSRKGWKVLNVRNYAKLGTMAMKVLERHSSTLESLTIDKYSHISANALVQVLSSCVNLHTLINANERSDLDAKVFADVDPITGSLKPWKCESTLKVLKVTIVGIAGPMLWYPSSLGGANPNQEQEMHNLVYDRLARLSKLETLCLGDCLKMSLKRGLHMLSGLKMLKELYTSPMWTMVGVEEVIWMTEHWPRLRGIYGLRNEKAAAWLHENHPEIKVTAVL